MFSCKKAGKLISESQDRKLSSTENISLKFHLVLCKFCRQVDKKYCCLRIIVTSISINIEEGELFGEGLSAKACEKINKTILEAESQIEKEK